MVMEKMCILLNSVKNSDGVKFGDVIAFSGGIGYMVREFDKVITLEKFNLNFIDDEFFDIEDDFDFNLIFSLEDIKELENKIGSTLLNLNGYIAFSHLEQNMNNNVLNNFLNTEYDFKDYCFGDFYGENIFSNFNYDNDLFEVDVYDCIVFVEEKHFRDTIKELHK